MMRSRYRISPETKITGIAQTAGYIEFNCLTLTDVLRLQNGLWWSHYTYRDLYHLRYFWVRTMLTTRVYFTVARWPLFCYKCKYRRTSRLELDRNKYEPIYVSIPDKDYDFFCIFYDKPWYLCVLRWSFDLERSRKAIKPMRWRANPKSFEEHAVPTIRSFRLKMFLFWFPINSRKPHEIYLDQWKS